ncbi:MAG: hypothetical protein WCY09_10050 [Candidatus Omnitrophota bacterium]|jgi:hypothetical protein
MIGSYTFDTRAFKGLVEQGNLFLDQVSDEVGPCDDIGDTEGVDGTVVEFYYLVEVDDLRFGQEDGNGLSSSLTGRFGFTGHGAETYW